MIIAKDRQTPRTLGKFSRRQHVMIVQDLSRYNNLSMADKVAGVPLAKTVEQTVNNGVKAAPKAAEGNPAFRMMGMSPTLPSQELSHTHTRAGRKNECRLSLTGRNTGLPNIKAKLPSRNWMIFLSITGSFAAAVYYDKRETARLQQKYCDMVAPLSEKILPTTTMPRRMTIYLQAPPADGLRSAREHFYEYVKPVLVAGAMDWDVVEGRREGDLRFGTAEKIRRYRRKAEGLQDDTVEPTKEQIVAEQRERVGCVDEDGVKGDLVIGRHAWKEYLRGTHEGWLGPLKEPVQLESPAELKQHIDGAPSLGDIAVKAATDLTMKDTPPTASSGSSTTTNSNSIVFDSNADDSANTTPETLPEPTKEEEPAKPKLSKPDPYISTSAYTTATLPSSTPQSLGPTIAIPLPHLLGFWNFPIRIHRFLTRRYVAEEIFSRTAAAVLASNREFQPSDIDYLSNEEKEWHKSIRKPKAEPEAEEGAVQQEKKERLWLDGVVVDDRITSRMRVFELPAEGQLPVSDLEPSSTQQPGWTYQGSASANKE
jgi:import inner membrane translocase subunit TIM54